jgi:hypothetical protein
MAELGEQENIARLRLPVSIKRDHIQGKSGARVTLIEYGTTNVHIVVKHIK